MSEVGDGTGGYRGLTNWNLYDVPAMWRVLEPQRTDAQWRQVAGWRKTAELAQAHLGRLGIYRDALARVWPPERNAAARAYLTRLDHLIDSVAQTAEVASANYTVLAATAGTIAVARSRIETIHREYVEKRQALETYQRRVGELASIGYHPWQPAPVTEAEVERLNTRARTVMFALSGELASAQTQIRQPPTYGRRSGFDIANDDVYGSTRPPTIPPIVPAPAAGRVHTALVGSNGQVERGPVVAPRMDLGPVLGGVAGPVAATASTGNVALPRQSASPPLPDSPGSILPITAMPPAGLGLPPVPRPSGPSTGTGRPIPIPQTTGPVKSGPPRPAAGELIGPGRALPPGGVIGGVAPVASRPTPIRQVNPVGGVISPGVVGPAGAAPVSRAGTTRPAASSSLPALTSPVSGLPGRHGADPAGGLRAGGVELAGARPWDPDDPWQTENGVPPVVLPPAEPGRHDPGPAIGLDR